MASPQHAVPTLQRADALPGVRMSVVHAYVRSFEAHLSDITLSWTFSKAFVCLL